MTKEAIGAHAGRVRDLAENIEKVLKSDGDLSPQVVQRIKQDGETIARIAGEMLDPGESSTAPPADDRQVQEVEVEDPEVVDNGKTRRAPKG